MRVANLLFFTSPFIISAVLTWYFSVHNALMILSYFLFLGMVIGFFTFIILIKQYIDARGYVPSIVDRYAKYNTVAVIPIYNESPKLVKDTALSVQLALGGGDVYVLDDSTDENIRDGIDDLKKLGINILRRGTRRGFKAGAINDFLEAYGNKYELIAIFDADQRPISAFLEEILSYFSDPKVAFIQIPQAYTETETGVGVAAYWQQIPFLRIIMRGRKSSAFSLGSGSVFRIDALKEIGGLDEDSVTEDVSSSVDLHAKGYKSVYIDKPLIWYGEPPKDVKAYFTQQARWSLGGFQLLPKLLRSNLKIRQFIDYITCWKYWFKEGPLTVFEILAPIFFLLLGMHFLRIDAILYLIVYAPFFLSTHAVFAFTTRNFYGFKGFFYHQSIELLAFPAVTASFIAWMLGRKRSFAVTPKKAGKVSLTITSIQSIAVILLILSVIKGMHELIQFNLSNLWFSTLINVFWAAYLIPFLIFGLYIAHKHYDEKTEIGMIEGV